MADINLRIVGTADMTAAQESINRLKASLAGLQAQYANTGSTVMFKGLKASINEFNQLNEASGRFRVHMLEAGTAADRLTERIRRNKTTYNDLHMAMQSVNKQGNTFLDIGKRTVAMQDAQAVKVGKTAYVYEDLGKTFASTGEKARVMSHAIAAQNQVLKEHAMNIINTGKNMQWTGRQLTMGITMPLVMFGAQVGKIFNEVDKNLTRLAKVYGVGLTQPTEQALNKIRTDVLALSNELSRSLGVSSAEVTDIAAQFAAAGMQGKELINSTRQAARAVVLGEADKQEAINATISLQTAYGLNTKELTEAINFFNAAQAATSTSMGDLINAIPRVGPVIKNLGGSYKDMVAILTALKEGGVPAGEAANAIKNSLSRIVAPTVAAQERLKSFGIDLKQIVVKNAGDLTGTITELQDGLKGLDNISKQQAITELFGRYQSARMTAFIENFNKQGSQSAKITEMMGKNAIELANIAETQTKKIQQSASGRFKIAVESMKNELIPFGEMFLNIFSNVAEKIVKVADAIKELPSGIKTFIKIMAGLTALVGPAVMIFGIFKSMAGSLLQGAIRIKQFAGAMRQLFTGGGLEGFKTIWRGFKETDLVAEAATRAVEVFEAKAKGMPEAAGVFEMGIDRMINSLQALSNQAAATGQSMDQIYGSTSATAASTIPGNYRGANIRSGRLQGVGFHHLSDLAETNKRLGIDDTGRQRGRRSNDQVYGLINVTPGSMAGPEYQAAASQVGNLVYSNEQEKAMIQDRLDQYLRKYPSVTPEMRAEASKTLPRSLSQFSSIAATMPAQLEAIASAGTAAVQRFNQEMAKIVSAFDSQDAATSAAQVDALVQSILATSGKEAEFAAKRQLNIKRITEAYRTGGKTAADAVIIEIEKEARAISAKAGLVGTAYGKGDSRGGGVRAALVSLASQLSATVQEVIVPAVMGDFSMTSGKGYAQIRAEAEAQGRKLQEFTATNGRRYIADVTDGIEKAIIVELSKNNVISGNAVPLDVRRQMPLLESTGTNRAAMDRAAQARRAREELARAKREGRVLTGVEAAGPNREAFDRAAEARARRRDIIDARIAQDISRIREERLDLERQDEEAKLKSKKTSAISGKLASGLRVAGGIGFAATSTMQMMGMGNETTNLIGQGISSASMLTGLVAGPWGIALQAVVAAMPLLIKGVSTLIEDSSKLGRAMAGAFKVSAFEAENLGIKINEIGKAALPTIGFGAAEASSKIDALSKQIEALGEEDPLKMFTASLKSQTVQDQIELLQQKYLTLRIQGVNDDEAREFVKAIMRAAGVEYTAGFGVNQFMAGSKNQSVSEMMGAQARAMVGMTSRSVNGLLDAGDTAQYFQQFADQGLGAGPTFDNPFGTWGPGADAARKSVEALTQSVYDLLLNTPKDQLSKILKNIEAEMDQSVDTTNLYTAAIRELYQQSGPVLSGYWESVKNANLSATEQLQIANIYFNGLIKNYNDLKYLTENPLEIEIRTRFIEEKENLAKATSGLAATLSKNATSQTYQAELKSTSLAAQKSEAQQSVVDKLKDELDLRKKILAAQERELAFNDRMISLRQQYNEALATNDMAKAAELQRQMNIEQVKYNNELAKDAMDDKLSKQQKKAADAQEALAKTAGSAKAAIENISDYSDEAMQLVYDALANDGKLANAELNKFAKELKDKFGVPIATTKQAIKDTLKEFQAQDVIKFATASANAFDTKWIPAQRKSAILAAFNSAVQTAESPESAMAHAIEVVMSSQYGGASVRASKSKTGGTSYIMTIPTGRGAYAVNVSSEGTVSDISPTYVTKNPNKKTPQEKYLEQYPRRKAGGGHITGPGTGTSDSIPAYLSNGEYVIRASSVQKYGKETFDALNAQKFADGGMAGEHSGSRIGSEKGGRLSEINSQIRYFNYVMDQIRQFKQIFEMNQEANRAWNQHKKTNIVGAYDFALESGAMSQKDYNDAVKRATTKKAKYAFVNDYFAKKKVNEQFSYMFGHLGEMGPALVKAFKENPAGMLAEMTTIPSLMRVFSSSGVGKTKEEQAALYMDGINSMLGTLFFATGTTMGSGAIKGAMGARLAGTSMFKGAARGAYDASLLPLISGAGRLGVKGAKAGYGFAKNNPVGFAALSAPILEAMATGGIRHGLAAAAVVGAGKIKTSAKGAAGQVKSFKFGKDYIPRFDRDLKIQKSHISSDESAFMMFQGRDINQNIRTNAEGRTGKQILEDLKNVENNVHPMAPMMELARVLGGDPSQIQGIYVKLLKKLESESDTLFKSPSNSFEKWMESNILQEFKGINVTPGVNGNNLYDALRSVRTSRTATAAGRSGRSNAIYVNGVDIGRPQSVTVNGVNIPSSLLTTSSGFTYTSSQGVKLINKLYEHSRYLTSKAPTARRRNTPAANSRSFVDAITDAYIRGGSKTNITGKTGGFNDAAAESVFLARQNQVLESLVKSGKVKRSDLDDFVAKVKSQGDSGHAQPKGPVTDEVRLFNEEYFKLFHGLSGDDTVRLYRAGTKGIEVSEGSAAYWTFDPAVARVFQVSNPSRDLYRADVRIADLPQAVGFRTGYVDEFAMAVNSHTPLQNTRVIPFEKAKVLASRSSADRHPASYPPGMGQKHPGHAGENGDLFFNPDRRFRYPKVYQEEKFGELEAFKMLPDAEQTELADAVNRLTSLGILKAHGQGDKRYIQISGLGSRLSPQGNVTGGYSGRIVEDIALIREKLGIKLVEPIEGRAFFDAERRLFDSSPSARVPSQIIPGILTPSQRASLPALLNQIISGHYPSALKVPGAVEMLRGLTRRTPHAMDFFHGRMMNRKYIEGLKPGDQVKLDGPISTSMDMAVAQNFAERKAGAAFDGIFKAQYPGNVGPTRFATTEAEKLESLRKTVMDKIAGIKQSKAQMRVLNEKIAELTSPSDLFGGTSLTPMQIKELEKLQKELQHTELNIGLQKKSLGYARSAYSRYRNDASVVIAMHTKDGVKYIPLAGVKDLNLPSQLNWKTLGIAQSEQEALMNTVSGVFRSREQIGDRRFVIHLDQVTAAGFNKGGMVGLPKYHTGGLVNYAYGSEVAAMLQGGEVVIPKEIVRDLKNGAVSNSSVYNNTPNITVNVAGTNASPQDIANAVSQAMQRRQDMVRTRTVIG